MALLGEVQELLVSRRGSLMMCSWCGQSPEPGMVFGSEGRYGARDSLALYPGERYGGRPPGLLWSPSLKALLFFPGMSFSDWREVGLGGDVLRENRLDMPEARSRLAEQGVDLPKGTREAAKLFTEWAARPSTRFTQAEIEEYPLYKDGDADHIIYISDKWNGRDGKVTRYIHSFSGTGSVKVSVAEGNPPSCFFIKGGRMTVNARGIVY